MSSFFFHSILLSFILLSLASILVAAGSSLSVCRAHSLSASSLASKGACQRGVSYPPPSPRGIVRSQPVPQSRNPPLVKTRRLASTSGVGLLEFSPLCGCDTNNRSIDIPPTHSSKLLSLTLTLTFWQPQSSLPKQNFGADSRQNGPIDSCNFRFNLSKSSARPFPMVWGLSAKLQLFSVLQNGFIAEIMTACASALLMTLLALQKRLARAVRPAATMRRNVQLGSMKLRPVNKWSQPIWRRRMTTTKSVGSSS